jgi:hypothetical protein
MPADDDVTRDGDPRPEAPDSLPQYLVDGLVRQDVPSLEDAMSFAEELRDWKQKPVDVEEDEESLESERREVVTDDPEFPGWDWVVKEFMICSDETCKCMKEDERLHGPYYFKVRRDDDGNREKEYIPQETAKEHGLPV